MLRFGKSLRIKGFEAVLAEVYIIFGAKRFVCSYEFSFAKSINRIRIGITNFVAKICDPVGGGIQA